MTTKKYAVQVTALYTCETEADALKVREIVTEVLNEIARVSRSGGGAQVLLECPDAPATDDKAPAKKLDASMN